MNDEVLVTYATKHGSTREIAETVAGALAEHGLRVDLRAADAVEELARYRAVVLGAALYTGRLHADARRFLARNRDALALRPLAVFAMGPRTLDEADVASSRRQLDHALARWPELRPAHVAIFGGVVRPAELRFPFSRMPASDARDWDAVAAWAKEVAEALAPDAGARVAGVTTSGP